ncbi:HD domain-containing protein [Paenibacillus mesophilus]|uniref:HD domain-containing protein n=1 Tax=Paenibacillus mesophilus TaxID=2582849 RepID=UPI00110EA6EE|nr:HD domain-containing protein [Paenibacillus mesophilus]TMV44260.1 HD domain-containing protein [Paenibacillus mesophilus]
MARLLMEEKVFKDPVHKYIYVQDETIWNLINTKEFQRLRRIRQLGTSFMTFHGAEHSRFSHSLGVYEVARRIISQFERNRYDDWPSEERLLCLCSALLHDIGHGPFSHSVEKVFGTHHEDWTCRLVLGDTEVNRVLTEADPELPQKVSDVICKSYGKEIVVGLISSQLDADRMDYLLRDAYYTGVHYGTFDLERILRVIRPHKGHIVVKESGMHAVEDYLMSRYQMYWQVYFHPVTRSSEIVLRKIFERAKRLHTDRYAFQFLMGPLVGLLDNEMTIEDYLTLDESYVQMTIMQWSKERDPILSDLCARFLNRRLFKYAALDDINEAMEHELRAGLLACGIDPEYYLEIDYLTELPYDVYRAGDEEESLPIWLLDGRNELVEISRKSDIIRSIGSIHGGKHHIYFPAELVRNAESCLSPEMRRLLGLDER